MSISVGIGLAFVAMLCWGIGDFLIQKSTRKIGNWETLFLITFFGALILLPFVYDDLPALFALENRLDLLVLIGGSLILFIAALLNFEALREGKISVVEPIWSLEIITATSVAFIWLGERLTPVTLVLIVLLMVGLFLISFRGRIFAHRHFLERGVWYAVCGAVFMGGADFFLGWGARLTDPLVANFMFNVVMTILSALYLVAHGRFARSFRDFVSYRATVLPMMITDNAAWIAYAFAMTIVPIGIATALSESSIVIAVILGLAVGHERLQLHQKAGLVAAIAAAVTLAVLTT